MLPRTARFTLISGLGAAILGSAVLGRLGARADGARVSGDTTAGAVASYDDGEWVAYGRDPGGMRHSPLTQINRGNVGQLEVAWTFRTGELAAYEGTSAGQKAAFEATPLMVDGALYLSTPTNRVFALDARTGRQSWVYDPKVDLSWNYSELTCRGVSIWTDPNKAAGSPGRRRIFEGTIDGRLIALDAATGRPCEEFGRKGIIQLFEKLRRNEKGQYQVTSPPAVTQDLVIVGTAIGDNMAVKERPGVVRAFDARTGKQRWTWDPIPRRPGDSGYDTWNGPIAHETGAANAWPPISVDVERDLLLVPTTSPSPDYYGGQRVGQNLYGNCVVALRASTGKMVWAFQAIHHDLWDYDVPMEPAQFTVEREGRKVPAVAFGTKVGHLFLLHRETGKPLFRYEERPVPQSDVPGEKTWPTQLFPVDLPLFGLRKVTPDDAWGATEQDREEARKLISSLRNEGPFTPVSLQGTIETPSNVGGFNWGGVSYSPEEGVLFGCNNRIADVVRLIPRKDVSRVQKKVNIRLESEFALMKQTPYALQRTYLLNRKRGLVPSTSPPWGTLVAVDMNTGKLRWEVPLGWMLDPKEYPEAEQWGSLSLGGPITTAGGLVFVAASMDGHLRAFDSSTGKLLWKAALPVPAQSTPMTYQVTPDGKQYVIICAGGYGKAGTRLGDSVIAYALPD
jgi:quinoprotein glucose dehydrogenase